MQRYSELILSGNTKQGRQEVRLWIWMKAGQFSSALQKLKHVIHGDLLEMKIKECSYQIDLTSLLCTTLPPPPSSDISRKSQHFYQPKVTVRWSESCLAGIDKAWLELELAFWYHLNSQSPVIMRCFPLGSYMIYHRHKKTTYFLLWLSVIHS